ncbi:DMT family transporter [Rhizobiales bacterium TNE-4]|nr:DMT family transporter [Rhizobiales bacterium TNE-4]MBV1828832.1 DMT family transporter [Rhizobiales bacterium TNE-4]
MGFPILKGERRNRVFGVGLILLATFSLAISDTLTRYVVSEISPRLVIFARYAAFTLITVPLLFMGRPVSLRSTSAPWLQALRAICVFLASFLFAIGLIWVPVANASAIAFVAPLIVVVFSSLLLGEAVSRSHWVAAMTGFAGVLFIVRPGEGGFGWAALFPILTAATWAAALLATKFMSATESRRVTACYTALYGLLGATVALGFDFSWPTARMVWPLMGVAFAGSIGQLLIVAAYHYLPASRLAPLSYVQLLWVILFSALLFKTVPDAIAFVGIAMVVGSGLYIVLYRRKIIE